MLPGTSLAMLNARLGRLATVAVLALASMCLQVLTGIGQAGLVLKATAIAGACSLLGACMGVIIARIVAEFVLIVFRMNEHLAAIRNQGSGMRHQ